VTCLNGMPDEASLVFHVYGAVPGGVHPQYTGNDSGGSVSSIEAAQATLCGTHNKYSRIPRPFRSAAGCTIFIAGRILAPGDPQCSGYRARRDPGRFEKIAEEWRIPRDRLHRAKPAPPVLGKSKLQRKKRPTRRGSLEMEPNSRNHRTQAMTRVSQTPGRRSFGRA